MTTHPKPARRGPKPRKRIARSKLIGRSSRPAAKRKTPRAIARRVALAAWAVAVKERAGGRCELENIDGVMLPSCPHGAGLDAHHAVFGKGAYPRLSLDPDVGIALCRPAHRWVHAHLAAFKAWFAAARSGPFQRLSEKARREARLA